LVDSLKESLVFGVISLPLAYVLVLEFRLGYFDSVGFVLLLESCGLMLIGGAMDLVSAPGIRRVVSLLGRRATVEVGAKVKPDGGADAKFSSGAAVYTLTGVILFMTSLAVAVALAS
jgi:hypothetical protein